MGGSTHDGYTITEHAKSRRCSLDYYKILKSDECYCGRWKSKSHAVCRRCYVRLPMSIRAALYKIVGEGFEDAYDFAVQWLKGQR